MTGTNAEMMTIGAERLGRGIQGLCTVLALLIRANQAYNALHAMPEPTTALVPSCSRLPAIPQFSSSDDE